MNQTPRQIELDPITFNWKIDLCLISVIHFDWIYYHFHDSSHVIGFVKTFCYLYLPRPTRTGALAKKCRPPQDASAAKALLSLHCKASWRTALLLLMWIQRLHTMSHRTDSNLRGLFSYFFLAIVVTCTHNYMIFNRC